MYALNALTCNVTLAELNTGSPINLSPQVAGVSSAPQQFHGSKLAKRNLFRPTTSFRCQQAQKSTKVWFCSVCQEQYDVGDSDDWVKCCCAGCRYCFEKPNSSSSSIRPSCSNWSHEECLSGGAVAPLCFNCENAMNDKS